MSFLEILLIATGLAMDAFAVSIGAGTSGQITGGRAAFRLAFHFGFFQFFMPILGWFAGIYVEPYVAFWDHWIAFGLLAFIGMRMISAGMQPIEASKKNNPSKGFTLIMLSVATSIDAFAVGFSLSLLRLQIWYPSVIIGVVTAGLSLLGLRLGNQLGKKFGKRMEIAGGLILIIIGARILVSHLLEG